MYYYYYYCVVYRVDLQIRCMCARRCSDRCERKLVFRSFIRARASPKLITNAQCGVKKKNGRDGKKN